mmetsp:Transcript_11314/g.18206  ORF Transcript_11314/g.18206 Transcript_11314/m.18206 type:complete len:150 (-) Transcript_11314:334-783(-)
MYHLCTSGRHISSTSSLLSSPLSYPLDNAVDSARFIPDKLRITFSDSSTKNEVDALFSLAFRLSATCSKVESCRLEALPAVDSDETSSSSKQNRNTKAFLLGCFKLLLVVRDKAKASSSGEDTEDVGHPEEVPFFSFPLLGECLRRNSL